MKISLIIPAYNEEKYIGECLKSAIGNSNGAFLEIIVIDNASTDKTKEVAEKFPGVRVVHEPQKGLTFARQKGLESAKGDFLAFIDADTKMPVGWPEKVIKAFSNDPHLVCVSGPYVYYDASWITRASVWLCWIFFAYPTYIFTGYMTIGGNFVAKKSALDKIDGFDKNINFYGEDTDIARRLHKIGKVKIIQKLYMYTSARRLKGQGLANTLMLYVANFFGIVFTGKPVSKEYKDLR